MTSLQIVRSTLSILGKQLRVALAADPRCAALLPSLPQYRYSQDGFTNGYWIQVGRLGQRLSMEFWIDHYSGLSTPRAWFGLSSLSAGLLTQIVHRPPLIALEKRLIKRATRDVTGERPYQFVNPLRSTEFDILVQEHYAGRRHYLGVFSSYAWPFSRHDKAAIVRDATNLAAMFCAAYVNVQTSKANGGTPGPWARPDPRTEKRAVRHVLDHLQRLGYIVRSREREICGYDLHATKGSRELHVEVKGCVDAVPRFFISRTELKASQSDPNWRLAVISCATSQPSRPRFLKAIEMRRLFTLEPTQWAGRPNSTIGAR